MTTLSELAAKIEAFAEQAVEAIKAEAEKDFDAAVEKGGEIVEALEPIVEDAFSLLVSQLGGIAANIVTGLFGVAGAALSGSEKADLAARQLIEAGFQQGVTVAAQDATTLIKNSYVAVKAILQPTAAPAS